MKRTLLAFALGLGASIYAQVPQLPNSDFELWEDIQVGATTVQEPVSWSGLKSSDEPSLAQLSPDGTLTQDVGRGGTGYSVKLETIYTLSVPANGSMTNGRFHAPLNLNPEEGYIYTDSTDARWHFRCSWRPDSLVAWYKYDPTGNDKGKIEFVLHVDYSALPVFISGVHDVAANRVGRARYDYTTTTNGQWVRISTPFVYDDSRSPTFMLGIITAGDSTISENNSKVWIDDIELIYNNVSIDEYDYNKDLTVYYDMENVFVNLQSKSIETFEMEVIDLTGKVVQRQKINTNKQTLVNPISNKGIYFLRVNAGNKFITRKIIVR